ncbi:hypothetical protein [Luteimonas mephitis]|uniref:hypothetical protein n=1 Tax=Luteimonas mephitis TaxID=83615 RepID=UPI0012EB2E58|nr:hypothetical protein [Luteimonas mephitis]
MSNTPESKRIVAFKNALIKEIPKIPNNKESVDALKSLPLSSLLIHYINWKIRLIGQRPRAISGRSRLRKDTRYILLKENIKSFLTQVEIGGDLTPYLSLRALSNGFAPGAYVYDGKTDPDEDKDHILNIMGLHHFHLGLIREVKGHQNRTDTVLLAFVDRERFSILGLFDHSVFEHLDDGTMSPERKQLWKFYDAYQSRMLPQGGFELGGYGSMGITTAGTAGIATIAALRHAKVIRYVDEKLDDRDFVRSLYGNTPQPKNPKLDWIYRNLDLGLVDVKASFFGHFELGPT